MKLPRYLELTSQTMPDGGLSLPSTELPSLAPSVPLWQLRDQMMPSAYDLSPWSQKNLDPHYPISNDESAACFTQTALRTETPDYRNATNRVALVVGESSLMAALGANSIPEDTVIIVDKDPLQTTYMHRYIEALLTSDTPDEWMRSMRHTNGFAQVRMNEVSKRHVERIRSQINEWEFTGHPHALLDAAMYKHAQEEASSKAFICVTRNLGNPNEMLRLGDTLKSYDAHITFANLTNVLACDASYDYSREWADCLSHLPFTGSAPILTTSLTTKDGYIAESTGPFWGLDNLREHGGCTNPYLPQEPGSVVDRKISGCKREAQSGGFEDFIAQIMMSIFGDSVKAFGNTPPENIQYM